MIEWPEGRRRAEGGHESRRQEEEGGREDGARMTWRSRKRAGGPASNDAPPQPDVSAIVAHRLQTKATAEQQK